MKRVIFDYKKHRICV